MNLVELTEAPDSALPVARLKEHLRLGTGFSDDDLQEPLLAAFLRAAIAAIEGRTGKALLRRRFELTLSAWTRPGRQPLPLAPVASLVSVALVPASGPEIALPPDALRLDADAQRPALVGPLPSIPHGGTARVIFEAGYGPAWSDLPADLAQAVLMLAAHYHEYRHDTALGPGCTPFGVSALIDRYRPIRLGRDAE
ncbi:head-tail connector protein [Rubellimicrobium aerolatum]|uniref:Phage gp6-like head-tail connector protein n=1 Tax=Rubellimicrobium aerolatum TaxID=490979 RepID=A0ABW0SBA3_9RHOB|nr:hypothetical protein [Rubellimicrobium aerolatum]MBP1805512.1 putative phiE125 gp8 family phage protein [Rubellimicrobium aerolatum]